MKLSDQVEIVRMQKSHLDAVLEIASENKLSYWSREAYESEIFQKYSCCLVVEKNKEVVGFIVMRLIMSERYAELYNIAVKKQYKNGGIGCRLLDQVTKYCAVNNLKQINLEVRESNADAVRFYLKHNFEKVALRKNFTLNRWKTRLP